MDDNLFKTICINKHEYKIYPDGSIISMPYQTAGCVTGVTKARMVKPFVDRQGYANVELSGKTYKMHYLIALLFLDNPNKSPRVIHLDGNKLNNDVTNLQWSDTISSTCAARMIPYYSFSLSDLPNEKWAYIPDTDNRYQISSYGRVKSCRNRPKILSPINTKDGYVKAAIMKQGKRVDILIHRTVASVFIGNCSGYEVDHIDGDRKNNSVDNLRIVSHTENMNNPLTKILLKKRKGPMLGRLGSKNPLSKPIYAINASGEIIEFEGSWDADRKGYKYCSVQACLHGKQKTYRGLKWFFR